MAIHSIPNPNIIDLDSKINTFYRANLDWEPDTAGIRYTASPLVMKSLSGGSGPTPPPGPTRPASGLVYPIFV